MYKNSHEHTTANGFAFCHITDYNLAICGAIIDLSYDKPPNITIYKNISDDIIILDETLHKKNINYAIDIINTNAIILRVFKNNDNNLTDESYPVIFSIKNSKLKYIAMECIQKFV